MWARAIEIVLGLWLAMNPIIFGPPPDQTRLWVNDLGAAAAVILTSLLSVKPALDKLHLCNLAVGAWLVGVGFLFFDGPPPSAATQNHVAIGLLLMMIAILPNRSTLPPRAWREFESAR